ncbi:hypothetical protein ASPZODRAFT_132604 [Penicilliopsis zonata CBS 506.65]|uniref:non-specific serine/threonine protein kinase n=1 Tax=Penicilliopsis zonata CBS 506.65 TaxID=1073090 RepID=A0A1L9SHL7_9EURO|nr:hypothetical protein ASPZODRAFT_132604 [Penicilliopsis zonata CBS 506.65]OJJ46534.1 hypothetical protein ASPZODRAFT_132604 [Penicilliopsis zonata CBS 506.65]
MDNIFTVWLARDSKVEHFVALKILRADCYGGPREIFKKEMLLKISKVSENHDHQGCDYISHLLDHFKHQGPNGEHVCFAFDVLRSHLDSQAAKYEDGRIPVAMVKTITRQLLLRLDFLHRECGIIHTDIKPANILFELENPMQDISCYLSETSPRVDNQSGHAKPLREVIRTPLVSHMKHPHIRIIDFGVASWESNHLSDVIQSPALRAPEVTIGAPWDSAVDIWSLGCLVVEFVQGIVLFSSEASEKGSWTADDDRLARMIEILGPFPTEFLKRGKHTAGFFDKHGNLRRIPNLKATSLERLLNGTEKPFLKPDDMPEAEMPVFLDFLRGMLSIDPKNRKSAAELLQHNWLKTEHCP